MSYQPLRRSSSIILSPRLSHSADGTLNKVNYSMPLPTLARWPYALQTSMQAGGLRVYPALIPLPPRGNFLTGSAPFLPSASGVFNRSAKLFWEFSCLKGKGPDECRRYWGTCALPSEHTCVCIYTFTHMRLVCTVTCLYHIISAPHALLVLLIFSIYVLLLLLPSVTSIPHYWFRMESESLGL